MSPLYTVFSVHDINYDFLDYTFKNKEWHKFMKANGNTGARHDRFAISDKMFFSMPLLVASVKEQEAICEYFQILEKKYMLENEKYQKLIQLKKSLLSKLLP